MLQSNVVYKIHCPRYESSYAGQTTPAMLERKQKDLLVEKLRYDSVANFNGRNKEEEKANI